MDETSATPEIHRADALARRMAVIGVLVAAAAGALALWWLRGWLGALRPTDDGSLDALLWSSFAVTMLVCSVCIVTAAMLWRIATATLEEDRYPPAALRTVRDVPVRRGDAARRVAMLCRVAAGVAAVLGVLVLGWVGWSLRALA